MDDFGKAEDILILGLVVVIGYGLYKFSQSFACAINTLIGNNSDPNCGPVNPNANPANTYTNAANQTVTSPWESLKTIFGFNQTTTPTAAQSAAASTPAGSVDTTASTASTPGGIGSTLTEMDGTGASSSW